MSRVVPWSIGIGGILLLVPGILYLANPGLTEDDVQVALKPILSVPLNKLWAFQTNVQIPDTPQWKRIRQEWGEPEFIISAVSSESENRLAYCLSDLALTVQVTEHGNPLTLRTSYPPYGYSQYCTGGNFSFRASPGTELSVSILKTGDRTLPSGELIIVGGWLYRKDKLAGLSVKRELLRPVVAVASILGFILMGIAGYGMRRSRVSPSQFSMTAESIPSMSLRRS